MNIKYHRIDASHGFTLIELVLVVIIGAILVTIALKSSATLSDTARVQQTKQELDRLAEAIVGNPTLLSRVAFGVISDTWGMSEPCRRIWISLDLPLVTPPGTDRTFAARIRRRPTIIRPIAGVLRISTAAASVSVRPVPEAPSPNRLQLPVRSCFLIASPA